MKRSCSGLALASRRSSSLARARTSLVSPSHPRRQLALLPPASSSCRPQQQPSSGQLGDRKRFVSSDAPTATSTTFSSSDPAVQYTSPYPAANLGIPGPRASSLTDSLSSSSSPSSTHASTPTSPPRLTSSSASSSYSSTVASTSATQTATKPASGYSIDPSLPHNLIQSLQLPLNDAHQQSSSSIEQLAILEACLATGTIKRAKRIFHTLRQTFVDASRAEVGATEEPLSGRPSPGPARLRLVDVMPMTLHAAFLRSFFRQAIVYSEGKRKGSSARRKAFVSEAWEWFEMLLRDERLYGRLDTAAWAVMFKGLVATHTSGSSKQPSDPAAPHVKSLSHLYSLLRARRMSLEAVLQDPIFSHAGLAGLNDHPAMEVADDLARILAEDGQTDLLAEVEEVRQRLASQIRFQDTSEVDMGRNQEQSSSSSPSTDSDYADHLPQVEPARRSREEEIPSRLGSLLGNLETITGQRLQYKDPYVRQELLEESAYDAARWQSMHEQDQLDKIGLGNETRLKGNKLQSFMKDWLEALTETLRQDLGFADTSGEAGPLQGPGSAADDVKRILRAMDPEKLAFITIVDTLRTCANASSLLDGTKATRAIILLGRTIEDEYGAESWKILYPDLYDKAMADKRPQDAIRRFMKEQGIAAGAANFASKEGYGDEADELRMIEDKVEREMKMRARARAMPWTQKLRAKVGGYLIAHLLDTARVKRMTIDHATRQEAEEEQPAFYQSYQFSRGQKVGVIKLNPQVLKRLDKDAVGSAVFPRFLPMLVPPKPWTSWNSGGYRIHTTEIVRSRDSPEQAMYMKMASEHGHLDQIYSALDVLGSTAWQINKSVFDVVLQVWNSGEALADIPVDNAETAFPDPAMPDDVNLKDPKVKEAYRVQLKELRNLRTKTHSQRCNLNYNLEIARAYLSETFYFPHNVDFRGRAYPIPPNLSHIGDDMSRGLLQFAEAKKLGSRGLSWLHIHVANTAGFDKASFEEREAFAKAHLEDIMDSADRPLEGRRWWLQADDAWQCLAACMELTKALRSPNPEDFESRLPVQQDGTCNGLQHYAALGGDMVGASQVNLAAGDRPADVYTAVAKLVNAIIERDLQSEVYVKRNCAEILKGKVTRKVVKQTVMTTVYGVTFIGAKRQIARQLKDRGDIPMEDQYNCASYLATNVLSSIGDLFKGASTIQLWLSICARLIGRAIKPDESLPLAGQFREPMASVIWTTPLGLPVCQPYRKVKKSQIDTALQSVFITDPNAPSPTDPRAQATAFPPNYIHSLDATHMMMTAVECHRQGIVYASVHDSYWTHARDVDQMSATLRDCFIKLHSQDLLGALRRDFVERYNGFIVRKSATSDAALKMAAEFDKFAKTKGKKRGTNEINVHGIATDLGSTALPPMTIASDSQLLKDAVTASSGEREDARLEERSFEDEEGETESDETEAGRPRRSAANDTAVKPKTRRSKGSKTPSNNSPAGTGRYYDLAAVIPPVPPRGDFDLEVIRHSPYFFS